MSAATATGGRPSRRKAKPEQGLLFTAERVEVLVLPALCEEVDPDDPTRTVWRHERAVPLRVVWLDPDQGCARVAVEGPDGEERIGEAWPDGRTAGELRELGTVPGLSERVAAELEAQAQRRREDDEIERLRSIPRVPRPV